MNWGNKLLITFLVFGAGMGYLVYRSMNTNYELVEKDYYKTELNYQQVIDASNRAGELHTRVKLQQIEKGILLQLPEEMLAKKVEGNIWFYCSYSLYKDKKFKLQINDEGSQIFSTGAVLPGNYTVKISWMAEGQSYYSEKDLTIL